MSEIILVKASIVNSGKFCELLRNFSRNIGTRVTCFKFSKNKISLEVHGDQYIGPGFNVDASDHIDMDTYESTKTVKNFWVALPEMYCAWSRCSQSATLIVYDKIDGKGIHRYLKCSFDDGDSHIFLSR